MTTSAATSLQPLWTIDLGQRIGQCRAAPVRIGGETAVLLAYGADFDVDPYHEMFFFPTDTLKLALVGPGGEVRWRRDLGRGVVPGMWFCPLLPFDLDGDGVDEIWYVGNDIPEHPLSLNGARLVRLDARDGSETGRWPWPRPASGDVSHVYRNFLAGGTVRGRPVLVSAQGTYREMRLQGWDPGMTARWRTVVPADVPGARGSHMCPVLDLDGDGSDELLWGERCIALDDGSERFCADRDVYRGHSDVILPFRDRARDGRWSLYTCRESDPAASPRVVCYDGAGHRLWGAVEQGHMDMGWVARLGPERAHVAMAIRIGHKTCGPDGRHHEDMDPFVFDASTGAPSTLPMPVYRSLPVDIDGDGWHELVYGVPGGDGSVVDRHGNSRGSVGGTVALIAHLGPWPGEQILSYREDGRVALWADRKADDAPVARERYAHPAYARNRALTMTGYNLTALGGI